MCGATLGCSGLESGIEYPSDLPAIESFVKTPENQSEPVIGFNRFKFAPEACTGIDTHVITAPLTQDDLTRFLEKQGVHIAPKKARGNLYWFDVPNGKDDGKGFVRLRLAVLEDPILAAADLHQSLLEHGPGWWGVRRGNLALLAPKAGLSEAAAFALKYKLVCWGVFTYAGNDDAYVVPGPYAQL
jgi:hypothetical protein